MYCAFGLVWVVCVCMMCWPTSARTIESLTAKSLKSTIEKKGASSRIDPGTACSLGVGLWGSAIPAPVVSPPMLLTLYIQSSR